MFSPFARRSEDDVAGHAIFAVGPPRVFVNGLNHKSLCVGVIVTLFFELKLAFGKFLNYLIGGDLGRVGREGRLCGRLVRRGFGRGAWLRQWRWRRRGVARRRRQGTRLLGG